jgi:hypothetical protein
VRARWSAGEAAQADYEALRAAAMAGTALLGPAAARFERRGLAGLVCWPAAERAFVATVVGARRPAWTPYADPRLDVLAAGYQLVLAHKAGLVIAKGAQP